MNVVFRPPTDADVKAIAANMRAMDRLECEIMGEHSAEGALRAGIRHGDTLTVEINGEPVAMFGLAQYSILDDEAAPWLLGVEGMERYARVLLTHTKPILARMLGSCEALANYVHADNRNAIRFLRWCGFSFGEAIEKGGHLFVRFEMTRRGH